MDAITNGATIEIVATGERFHTLNDWGLAIGNNDYIGDVAVKNLKFNTKTIDLR